MNSRRYFIKSLGRSLVAGTLAGTAGWLILRTPSGEACDFDFPCSRCKKLSSCKEQKASDFRDKNNSTRNTK